MPHVDVAIAIAKEFATDEMELVEKIGCNVGKLVESMKNYGK